MHTLIVLYITIRNVLLTELAQLEERSTFNRVVVGSSPIFGDAECFWYTYFSSETSAVEVCQLTVCMYLPLSNDR